MGGQEHSGPSRPLSLRRSLSVAITLALLVRVAVLLWTFTGPRVLPDNPMARDYIEQGYALSAGWGYVAADHPDTGQADAAEQSLRGLAARVNAGGFLARPETAGPCPASGVRPATLHPPGMALLVAALHRLLAGPADLALQITGILIDAAAAGLVCWMVTRCLGPKAGLASGLAYALFLPLAYASVSKVPDGLMGGFIAGSLAMVVVGLHREGWRRIGAFAAAGAILGVASHLRPDYAAMPLALLVAVWAVTRRFASAVIPALTMQLVVLLVLFPWAWRNHTLSGRWIFTSASVGPTLITGLGEYENPWGFGRTDEHRAMEAQAAGFDSPWTFEADQYFREVFWSSVSERPLAYAGAVLRRVPLALATPLSWGYQNPSRTSSFSQMRSEGQDSYAAVCERWSFVLAGYWDMLLPAALCLICSACVVILFLRPGVRKPELLLLLTPHLYGIGSHLFTHLEPRFLLPSIGFWLVALVGLVSCSPRAMDRLVPARERI